jgi:hypothetical protein
MLDKVILILLGLTIFVNFLRNINEKFTQCECTPENDCFPGNYARTQEYTNVCPPDDRRLGREKIHLVQNCTRTLGNFGRNSNCNQ